MRYKEFLPEYSDIEDVKKQVVSKVQGLDPKDADHLKLLDRIYKVLNKGDIHTTIEKSFYPPVQDEAWNDKTRNAVVKDIAQIIFDLDADVRSTNAFLDKMSKGGVVNVSELAEPANTFFNVFDNDAVALAAFQALQSYGVGNRQKGPGEYGLAVLSNKVRLSEKGDLEVDGIGMVELKAQKSDAGGRLGHGGLAQDKALEILQKYAQYIPSITAKFEQGAKGMGLKDFVSLLNNDLPVSNPEFKKIRQALMGEFVGLIFPSADTGPIIQAIGGENVEEVIRAYVAVNWAWYHGKDPFDALLAISFPSQKTMMLKGPEDLINMRDQGQLNDFSIRIVPTSAGQREVFLQLSISKKKG